jgi:hypothetical protein
MKQGERKNETDSTTHLSIPKGVLRVAIALASFSVGSFSRGSSCGCGGCHQLLLLLLLLLQGSGHGRGSRRRRTNTTSIADIATRRRSQILLLHHFDNGRFLRRQFPIVIIYISIIAAHND